MTAPLVVSGAIARGPLASKGVRFVAHATQIGRVTARPCTPEEIEANVERTPVRCADLDAADRMIAEVEEARRDRDSVGGSIEGMPASRPRGGRRAVFRYLQTRLLPLLFPA